MAIKKSKEILILDFINLKTFIHQNSLIKEVNRKVTNWEIYTYAQSIAERIWEELI